MRGLKGKVVMITGAVSGIGRATAQRFYKEGAQLLLVDIVIDETLSQEFPERMTFIQASIAEEKGLAECRKCIKTFGLDILINNAGITRDATLGKMTLDAWDEVVAVNLTGVFRLSQIAAAHMKERNSGVILNAASVVAHYGNFGQVNYVATKAGVIGLTKTLAKELGKYNIRVNAVAPGFIKTPMVEKMPEKIVEKVAGKPALKRMGKPTELASVYAFLASDEASYITGTTLNVDGGLVIS